MYVGAGWKLQLSNVPRRVKQNGTPAAFVPKYHVNDQGMGGESRHWSEMEGCSSSKNIPVATLSFVCESYVYEQAKDSASSNAHQSSKTSLKCCVMY